MEKRENKRLIIAFKIEDEHGNDVTPDTWNTAETPLGENIEIGKREAMALFLTIKNFLFHSGNYPAIRHLFPESEIPDTVRAMSNDIDVDRFRWRVSEVYCYCSQIERPHNNYHTCKVELA